MYPLSKRNGDFSRKEEMKNTKPSNRVPNPTWKQTLLALISGFACYVGYAAVTGNTNPIGIPIALCLSLPLLIIIAVKVK